MLITDQLCSTLMVHESCLCGSEKVIGFRVLNIVFTL